MQALQNWFREQLACYCSYHRDHRNQLTHHFGVPLIVFSLFIPLNMLVLAQAGAITVTLSLVFLMALLALYLTADLMIGALAAVFYLPLNTLGFYMATTLDAGIAWGSFGAFFIGGWIIQLIGHVFEGRKPALMDNLTQIFMAPFFLLAEMFFMLGMKQDLHDDLQARSLKYDAKPKSAPDTNAATDSAE